MTCGARMRTRSVRRSAHADESSAIVLVIDRARFERVNTAALASLKITSAVDDGTPVVDGSSDSRG
jgi:hypothetical protein